MDSSTVQCDGACLEKQNSTLWQNILISCKKIFKDTKSDDINPVRITSHLFFILSQFSLYTVITAKCKVYWPLPPQSVFVFFFSRRYFAFMIVHTSSSLSLQVQSVLTCTSPIHYKANRGGRVTTHEYKSCNSLMFTRFRLQYIPQSISKY